MELELTDNNFFEEVLKNEGVVLVDFWAPWCGPCQMVGPIIEELAKEFEGKVKIGKCNVDGNQNTAADYGIMSIPSIKIFKAGKVVKEFVGVQSKETLTKALQELA